jgi:hypothetical protein
MNTRQEHGEPERGEGLGGRVRRFVDNELGRVLDKRDPETDRSRADYRRESDQAPEFDRSKEPVTPYADAPGRVSQPVTTTPVDPPVDPGYDTPGYEPPAHNVPVGGPLAHGPRVEEAEPGQLHGHLSGEAGAGSSAERVGLLNDPAGLRDQWQRVQGTFVDDPQRAVQEASVLVHQTLQEIRENVTRGQASDPTSTEDLRVSFQRYREFFQRLLSA